MKGEGTMKKTICIIHFNTPELTEAAILSLRKHCAEPYDIVVFDNSDKRPFTKKMKGVKVLNNRHTSWQIEGGKVETASDFIFLGSKITKQ